MQFLVSITIGSGCSSRLKHTVMPYIDMPNIDIPYIDKVNPKMLSTTCNFYLVNDSQHVKPCSLSSLAGGTTLPIPKRGRH